MLRQVWPIVEEVGLPILFGLAGFSFFSLNFYWRSCSNLRRLEKYLKKHNSDIGYRDHIFPIIGLSDVLYGFKPISKFEDHLWEYPQFREHVYGIRVYRKIYRVVFPLVFFLGVAGIAINELIIDV